MSIVTENLPLKVFVQWFNATWFSVQKKGVKCGRSVDLVVVRDKHLFSDTPGTPAGLAVDRCWHEREWNQEPFSRTRGGPGFS